MADFNERQDPDGTNEGPPHDLNPRVPTKLAMSDSFLRSQFASLEAPNSNPRPLQSSLELALLGVKLLPNSQVPPRPKPPVPSEFFVYPKRSWRSMTKGQVRMHVLDRYAARQRYIAAYKEWNEKHNKWIFGIYHLMRAVTKSERQGMKPDVVKARENRVGGTEEAGAQTAPTDVMDNLDVDFDTVLTALQEGAEVDEHDRIRRWWIQTTKQNRPKKKTECISTPVLAILERQGKDTFGSRGSESQERDGTPDVDLPHQAARRIHSNMSSCVPPKSLSGQDEASMSESEEESDDDHDEEKSSLSWRIYSDQCVCGYARCHCRSWLRWWNKTLDMIKYVEHVDYPVSMSGISSVPLPSDGLLGGPPMKHIRLSVGNRQELVKREPPVRSLHKLRSPNSKKRTWSLKEYTRNMTIPKLAYCSRVEVERQNHQEAGAGASSAQMPPKYIIQIRSEDRVEGNPKVPREYFAQSTQVITQRANSSVPRSVVAILQWPSRNRTLQMIAYIHYTFRLPSEIFFLAINLLNHFTVGYPQITSLSGVQWELVGFACLWLAWKYENYTSVPLLDDLIAYSGFPRLTRDQIIQAEWTVRNTIGLDFSYPSPLGMMRLDLMVNKCPRETKYMARFLVDVSATVHHLVTCPAPRIGSIAAWLACILTDVSLHDDVHRYFNQGKAITHGSAMQMLMGVLTMPRPIDRPHEQALFYKWTLPVVNNIAEWCRQTLDYVWPHQVIEDNIPAFSERLLVLRTTARSRPFVLGPGPPPEHALFEA